jgi:predicted DNA-binding protein (UPF0251 family)
MTPAALEELRRLYNLSQREAAARVGTSQATWHRWEQGAPVPPLVAWALGTERRARALLGRGELLASPVGMTRPMAHPGGGA